MSTPRRLTIDHIECDIWLECDIWRRPMAFVAVESRRLGRFNPQLRSAEAHRAEAEVAGREIVASFSSTQVRRLRLRSARQMVRKIDDGFGPE